MSRGARRRRPGRRRHSRPIARRPAYVRRRRTVGKWFGDVVNSPPVAGWFLVVIAVVCGVFAVDTYGQAVSLRDEGVRTVAEVVEVRDSYRDSNVVLRFRTRDGRAVEAVVGNYRFDPEPRVGDRQEVVYDPDDPEYNVADVRTGPDFTAPWFLAAGCLAAAVLAGPTFSGRIDWREWR